MRLIQQKYQQWLVLWILSIPLLGCDQPLQTQSSPLNQTQLVIYSGITMVKPLRQLAYEFEKANPTVKIKIVQGASGYLLKTLKQERRGDIYFPGSESYRLANENSGLFQAHVFVGYNRLALLVAENNPKNLTHQLKQLADPELSVVIGAPNSGSIGKTTAKLLSQQGIKNAVFLNASFFTTDSHQLAKSIQNGKADLTLNWYTTSKWKEYSQTVDAILLPTDISQPKKLELNLLSFSKHPKITKRFMAFASSKKGLETFHEFGFFTDAELNQALKGKAID